MIKKLLIFVLVCALGSSARSADLKYLVDMRTALIDCFGLSGTTDFYTTAKLNRWVNRAVKFVEAATKSSQRIVRWKLVQFKMEYALDDTVDLNGVEFAYITKSSVDPIGLSYKPMAEFKIGEIKETQFYTLWANRILLNWQGNANESSLDSLCAMVYNASFDLSSDSSVVPLPRGAKRELAVDYAYILGLKASGQYTLADAEWQKWLIKYQLVMGSTFKQSEQLSPGNP